MATFKISMIRKMIYGAILFLILVASVELFARLTEADTYFQNRFFVLNRALDYPDVFKKDRDLFWRFRSGRTVQSQFFLGQQYTINSFGLRGPEFSEDKTRPRLIAIGNSCTFGWGVIEDSIYLRQLETLMDNRYEVINGAIPGYTSLQGKRFLSDDLIRLEPDIVLVLFAWNDIWAASGGIADSEQQFPPEFVLDLQNCLARLHSYRLLKKIVLSTLEEHPDSLFDRANIVYRVPINEFETNLTEICGTANVAGATPVLMTSPIPSLETYYGPHHRSPLHHMHFRYNQIIRKVARETGSKLIDLALAFDEYDDLFDDARNDPIHFNARGHSVAAGLIYRKLGDFTDEQQTGQDSRSAF
ncbi:MAG: SGNH/GDSL hydrolase family protein [candidate division Zixibacteria bacterium]